MEEYHTNQRHAEKSTNLFTGFVRKEVFNGMLGQDTHKGMHTQNQAQLTQSCNDIKQSIFKQIRGDSLKEGKKVLDQNNTHI